MYAEYYRYELAFFNPLNGHVARAAVDIPVGAEEPYRVAVDALLASLPEERRPYPRHVWLEYGYRYQR